MRLRHGDVLIIKTEKVMGKKLKHLILAEGEVTGHAHRITEGDATLYEHDGTLYLSVESETAKLTHEEHKTIAIPKGTFKIGIVQEVDPFTEEIRRVQD